MGPGTVQRSSPSAEAIAAQQAAEAARRAEEARRRAEEAARRAAEEARKAAEEARKAAEAARKKAEDAKRAAEAAEKKAAETKAKQDAEEAAKLRKQAEAEEAAALKKEAQANLKDKEATLAESKLDDVRQRRPDNEPSAATRKAQAEVKAAKETMEIYEPPAGQPTAGGEASAETKALLDKAQKVAKPVFEAQARGEKLTDAQIKTVNDAVNDWLKAAEQDMRTAGLEAQAKGEDPNKAIHARGEQIKKDIDKGGVFDPEWMGGHVDAGRDAVKAETPAIRQVRSEQYELQVDGKKQLAEAGEAATKADAAADAARKRADAFTSVSTDSQATAKQEAEAEATRLEEIAEQANRKLEGLKKTFGVSDAADPKNNTVGTLDAEYDAKVADLEVQDLAGRRNAAIASGDNKTADALGAQLDDAIARQRLARTRSDALKADLDLGDARTEKADADDALKLAQEDAPKLREVTYSGRGGKTTQTITPDGYDKTLWVKPGDKNVREIDGKWYLIEKTRGGERKTEVHPAAARVLAADKKFKEAEAASKTADGKFTSANEDILGPQSGRAPGKLDIEALGDPKKINDDQTATSHNAWVAQNDLNKAIAAGKSDAEIAKLRQDLGAKLQAWEAAKAQQGALKALTELRDAERDKASGKDVSDKKIEELRTTARDAVDKAREKPLISADDEKKLRADAKTKGDDLKTQGGEVEKAKKAHEDAKPEDKASTKKAWQDAMDKYDQLALESRDLDSRVELLDAERQSLAAKDEYGRTKFVQPHEALWEDRYGDVQGGTVYPDNYDPTWDITPDKLPEGAKVNHCGDDWYVTFDKDSKVLGYTEDKKSYIVREGTYKMHPATARLWAADERLKAATESRNTVIEDRAKAAVDRPAANAAAPVGLDGKPLPTLDLGDDLGARKKVVDGQVADTGKTVQDLENQLKVAYGDTTELTTKLEDARAAHRIALSEQSAVDAMLAWQTAHRQRQMDDANARAGRPLQYSSGDTPLAEKVNDLRDTALKKKSEWLTARDKHGVDLAQRTLDKAQKTHDSWKREHPYLLGSERNSDSWKALEQARGGLDIAKRQQVFSANERALIDQQQYISSRLRENEHEDPNKLYKLFMENKQVMAQSVINQHYVEHGGEPMQMAGRTQLGNEVAFALGFSPSVKLDPGTPSVNAQRRREENLFATLGGDQRKVLDATVDKIVELGGENARVTILPVVYALDGDKGGIVKTALFKVERADGSHKFVDDQGREYEDTDDFRANNMLPVENVDLAMPADGKYDIDDKGNVKLFTGDARTETDWENFRRTKHVDAIVGGVGFVAGVVLTVGSLGTLSVPGAVMMGAGVAMMGAGAYGVVTSAQSLQNQADHGVSINPFTNEQARMDWMNLGLSAASIPVAGASGRAAQLMAKAGKSVDKAKEAKDAVTFAKHMDDAKLYMERAQAWGRPAQAMSKPLAVASVPVMAEGGRQLANNWEHLSGGQRFEQAAMMGLNVAGFASPVFAKGYVRIHNKFKDTYNELKTNGAPPPMREGNPAHWGNPALTAFQDGSSPLVVPGRPEGGPPATLFGPDGRPISTSHTDGNTSTVRPTLIGPDGQPLTTQQAGDPPAAPAAPLVPKTPDVPVLPRLVIPDAADPAVQALMAAAPHQIQARLQDAGALATEIPIAGEYSPISSRRSTGQSRPTALQVPATRSERSTPASAPKPATTPQQHVLIPMEMMSRFRSLSRGGYFRNPEIEVLVYSVPKEQRGQAVTLTGKANSMGLLDRDYAGIRWQDGSKAREAFRPRHVFDEFGKPSDGMEHVMLLAPKGTHEQLAAGGTVEVNAWATNHRSMGLADGEPYVTAPYSFAHSVRGDRGATAFAGNDLYYAVTGLLNKAVGRRNEGPDPLRYVSESTSFSVGRRPIPAQDMQSGLVVWDPHNHPNVFAGPHYLEMKNFLGRMNDMNAAMRADPTHADKQVQVTLSYEMIPYRTQMLGGAWAGYTHRDTISISSRFGHMQDLQMLNGWNDLYGKMVRTLGPEEARRQQQLLIPSLTGIETYAVGHPSEYASGVGAHDYLARALLSYPDAYPMVGEINGRKEMKSLLDGRGNNCCRPLSTDIGRSGTQVNEALFGVLDATRESGMVTVLHSDWGAMEFGNDGRPIEAPGDSRDFFKITRMLMDLGPYDMSSAPKDRPLTNADVKRIVDNGPVRNPARIVLAHLGIGNWVRGSPHHLQLVRWALDHPLLQHVNFDSSWLPSIEMYAGDPGFRQQMVSLIQSGRIFYAGDQTNFQTPEQLLAPWYAQQPLLRALQRDSQETLNTYASGGFRNLYEHSKPDMDWYRYRKATDGSMEPFIRSMPDEAQQALADWVSRYESAHPSLRTDPTTRPQPVSDPARGRAPLEPRLPMEIRLPRAPEDQPNALDAESGSAISTAFAADPHKPHRLDDFDAWLYATVTGRQTRQSVEDVTNLGPSRRLIHGAQEPRQPSPLPQLAKLPDATHEQIQLYMAKQSFGPDELARLSQRRADRGGLPYTEEAMKAGRLAAENGAPRGLQLKTMELVDIVSRRQDGNNAYLAARNRREIAGIVVALAGVGAAMVGGGVALHGGPLPQWAGPSALWTRAMSTFLRTGNQQLARKISEGIQEQSIVKPEMLQTLASRMERWGPRMGLDPQRFQGDHSLRDVVDQAMVDMDYMLNSPINKDGGETIESRRALLNSTFSSVLAAVDREIGAQWSGVEWTNFRTLPGGAMSMAASLAYGAGVLGSLGALGADFVGNWYHVPLVGANGLFATYHMVGAVTGRFGHNWTELPIVRQTMNRGAWPLVSLGTAGWTAHSLAAAAGSASLGEAALHLGSAGFAALASHATYKLAQAGWRAEGLTGQHQRLEAVARRVGLGGMYDALQFGGVDKPRVAPLRNLRAGLGLAGLGAMMWLQNARGDDDKARDTGPKTPGPLPGITPTTSWPPQPGPSTTPTGADPWRPTVPDDGLPLPSDRQPRREKVVADGQQRQTGSLWGIAEDNVATLLTRDQERLAGSRGGHDTVVSDALAQLLQINPQRRFRPELMDGIVTAHPGDPDTILEGWSLNVNAVTR